MLLAFPQPVNAQEPEPDPGSQAYCLSCHSNPDAGMTLANGEVVSIYVSPDDLAHSIHSVVNIQCQNCHTDIHTYPHPARAFQDRRDLTQSFENTCQSCHSSIYDRAHDSVHEQIRAAGNKQTPVCSDCHGAHYIQRPDEPRSRVSQTCGNCHVQILDQYRNSVHGAALLEAENPDVPVCTDCHGVHDIPDPRTEQFRIESPELCARCHANPELMAKYGISADVYEIYKLSWHGMDVAAFNARWPGVWHKSATCIDCHGVHNILPADNPASQVNSANLLGTCQKCHPTAGPNFTGAWTGHHRISLERTPFVFYTQVFYDYFQWFILWGSVGYVLLQVIRSTVARARRSI
jgi:predicted CXXCH cytochrome family protein